MDEGKDEENNNQAIASSWWGSSLGTWIQSAKEKSSSAYEFMKRDLTEFTQVVQTDAVAAVSSTAAMLKDKLSVDTAEAVAGKARQSLSSVLGTITDVFAPVKEIEEGEPMLVKDSELVPLDWWQTQLYMIRKDPKTYCHEPEGPPEMYESWLESFDISDYTDEMTTVMISYPSVQEFYDKLVPKSVSHIEFWRRYFYRVHLLRKTEAKRADLIRRAEALSIEDIEWDKDENSKTFQSHKQPENSVVRHVTAEINIQNAENSRLLPSATENAQSNPASDSLTESAINIACLPNNPVSNADKKLTEFDETAEQSSATDVTDESRSSPVDSLGKDYSTGDEWEKDFEAEINDLKNQANQEEKPKEEEDDWEKCQ